MEIKHQSRIPAVDNLPNYGCHFRAFQFHSIAIEVKILAVWPDSHAFFRARLLGPVVGTDFIISIRIEVRDDQNNQVLKIRMGRIQHQFPGQH